MQAAAADEEDDDDEIFVYMGGDQEVPEGVRRARIHKSVKRVPQYAFYNCMQLIYVEFHDGIEIIERAAFYHCHSLKSVKLVGVKIIQLRAFAQCKQLTDVEFGDELETIGMQAFQSCESLKKITMPSSVRIIGELAFLDCLGLSDVECGEGLERILRGAFNSCRSLLRIVLPLKGDIIPDIIAGAFITVDNFVFPFCPNLRSIDLVGGVHKTVASLHLEGWRIEMKGEIDRINQVLPNTEEEEKTEAIQQWMRSVIHRLDHYKAEHCELLKEATTLLELTLWKANLGDNEGEGGALEIEGVRMTRGRRKRARKETCVTSGASVVIKNVLPFLRLQ